MKIPELQIGSITARIPIVQGGMGVRVSLSKLASAVANEGGIGTIASVGLGDVELAKLDFEKECREALRAEIRAAKALTKGHLAVNVMGVLSNAEDLVRTAVEEGISLILFGAGLPTKLPDWVGDNPVNMVPIISSARVAELILRVWDRRYQRTVDGFILEGPLAGGHLGFSFQELEQIDDYSLENLLPEVLKTIRPYEEKYGGKIPVIAAGGIYDGKDIARMLSLGAAGVQMGTRFVCTEECDVSVEFKKAYIQAEKEDVIIIKSPVGMPGRAIRNRFLRNIEKTGHVKIRCPYRCLTMCKVETAKYCIAKALVNACHGDVDHGLIFCGQNAYRVDRIVTVKELIKELLDELAAA
jgi:NAD(P)H-dependent flavin oxidoreductase YrpB (nitropropane dioxygenase family)